MMDRRQIQHAQKYAEALDKIYMLEKYQEYYPNIFKYVEIKTRPATSDDYFVPTKLSTSCLVIDSLRFVDKRACDYLGCFPFKSFGEPCNENDRPQLSPLGNTTTLSCQKMCQRAKHIDTEWWDDRCVQVNPLKKLVTMFPERVFGRKSYHEYHNGLDWKKGRIALNAKYCQAYGMEFNGDDCTMTLGQKISEAVLGTTVYRSVKTSSMTKVNVPQPVYVDLIYMDDPIIQENVVINTEDATEWALEITRDLGIDFGIDLSLHMVKQFLEKRAPRLILQATTNVGVKNALSMAVMRNSGLLLKGSLGLAKAVGAVSVIFSVYSIINLVVDIIDPNMYNYLLTSKMLKALNFRLDIRYFQQDADFNQEITPDFVWDYVLDLENQSDRILYMAENINAYLQALVVLPPDVITQPPASVKSFPSTRPRSDAIHWNLTMHFIVLGMLLTTSIIWRQWVHVWSLLVLVSIFLIQ